MDRQKGIYFLRLFVSLAIIVGLFWLIDLETLPGPEDIRVQYIIAALAIAFADRLLNAYKWSVLVEAAGLHIRFINLLKIYFTSGFVGQVLPSSVGGEVLKGYGLAKATAQTIDSAATVVVDRITGLLALSALCVIGYYLAGPTLHDIAVIVLIKNVALLVFLGTIAISLIGFVVPESKLDIRQADGHVTSLVKRVWRAFYQYKHEKAKLAVALVASFVIQIIRVIFVWLAGLGLSISVAFGYFVMFVPFIQLGSLVPISLGGMGVEEGMAVYLFSLIGAEAAAILSMFLLVRVLVLISISPGGWFYFKEGLGARAATVPTGEMAEKVAR